MTHTNISLPEPIYDWVTIQAKENKFASSSDYVCKLINDARIASLQKAITEGLESGITERSVTDIIKAAKAEIKAG